MFDPLVTRRLLSPISVFDCVFYTLHCDSIIIIIVVMMVLMVFVMFMLFVFGWFVVVMMTAVAPLVLIFYSPVAAHSSATAEYICNP